MLRKHLMSTMVQAITVLTVLKMLTNAQTTCNHGMGRVVYERIPDHQLQGFDDDVVRDVMPPFRMLEKCQDLCLRDRTAVNNLVRTCTSFNFQPGMRIASFNGNPEYEESVCYLTREQAHPEGIGNLVLVPNSVHYTEVCLTSNRIERECPNRRYVFERHPRKKLKLLASDHKEVQSSNRTDCEEKCLNEFSFICRSATYNSVERTCSMSRFTRRSHPELLHDDPNADYLENTCLSAERRCDGLAVFVKEENKKLGGPFEVDMYINITLEECQNLCLRAEKYFCRSIEYDERRRECIVSEEDSISQRDDLRISSSPTRHLFDLVCLDNPRGEFPDNSVTSHLFADGRRPDTAFQRFRNSRLGGEFHSEITSRTLSECLDECLRQASFHCRSAVYSERLRVCRLSRFNQRDGHRIIYDAEFDYYENLMGFEGDNFGTNFRPDPLGQDTNYHSHGRPPFVNGSPNGGPGYNGGHHGGSGDGGGSFGGGQYSGGSYSSNHYVGSNFIGGGDYSGGRPSPSGYGRPIGNEVGPYVGGPGGFSRRPGGYGGPGNYDGRPSYTSGPGGYSSRPGSSGGYGGRPDIGDPGSGSGYRGRPYVGFGESHYSGNSGHGTYGVISYGVSGGNSNSIYSGSHFIGNSGSGGYSSGGRPNWYGSGGEPEGYSSGGRPGGYSSGGRPTGYGISDRPVGYGGGGRPSLYGSRPNSYGGGGRPDGYVSGGRPTAYGHLGRPDGYWSEGRPDGYGSGGRPDGYGSGGRPDGYGSGGRPDGYGSGGRPDGYGSGGRPDGYGSGGRPDGYGNGGRPDGYGSGGRPDGYGSGGRPDGYGSGGRPDGYGSGGRPDGYGSGGRPDGYGSGGRPDGYGSGGRPDGYGSGGRPDRYGSGGRPGGYGSWSRPDGYGGGFRPGGFGSSNEAGGYIAGGSYGGYTSSINFGSYGTSDGYVSGTRPLAYGNAGSTGNYGTSVAVGGYNGGSGGRPSWYGNMGEPDRYSGGGAHGSSSSGSGLYGNGGSQGGVYGSAGHHGSIYASSSSYSGGNSGSYSIGYPVKPYPGSANYPGSSGRYPDTGRYPNEGAYSDVGRYSGGGSYPFGGRYPESGAIPDWEKYPETGKYPDGGRYSGGSYPDNSRYPGSRPHSGYGGYPGDITGPGGHLLSGSMYGGGSISSTSNTFSVAYGGDRYSGGGRPYASIGPGGSNNLIGGHLHGAGIGGYPGGGVSSSGGSFHQGGGGSYPGAGYPVGGGGGGNYPGGGYPVGGGGGGNYPGGGYPVGGGSYPDSSYPQSHSGTSGGFSGSGYTVSGNYGGFSSSSEGFYGNKFSSRCDDVDNFRQVGVRLRIRRPYVKRFISTPSVSVCERECADARDFVCRSFNYRSYSPQYSSSGPENCELSDKDSRELEINSPAYYETSGEFDYFERTPGGGRQSDCLEVSQQCSEDGMEFALKTPEGFYGRIYTYGYYDRCFFRGNGGTINVLRISGAQGYPDCGTEKYGDTMTNIVVVQFSDYVQTGRDKRYNLTCLFRGPGEAVVTSGYIGAGSGSPIPIEYLPAENSLSSRVRLMILYQNRPTTTIAVGDPLTFRLEALDNHNYAADIFATNVIARDPYSGRSVQLIDRYGCPVDNYVFPGLDRSRDGDGLEARFNAFKIPESNFLVFEATVRTCRDGCQPAYCTGQAGRSEPSFGRRRRSVNATNVIEPAVDNNNMTTTKLEIVKETQKSEETVEVVTSTASTTERKIILSKLKKEKSFPSTTIRVPIGEVVTMKQPKLNKTKSSNSIPIEIKGDVDEQDNEDDEEEFVREMIKVLDSRVDIANEAAEIVAAKSQTVCLATEEYYGLLSALAVLLCALLVFAVISGVIYRKYWTLGMKNSQVDESQPKKGGLDRRPFSFLVNASQAFRGRKANLPRELINECNGSFASLPTVDGKIPYGLFGLKNRLDSDFRRGNLESTGKKLKEGTFGKAAGSFSKKMLDSLFFHEGRKGCGGIENPLKCDDNFTMTKPEGRLEDPSEPIYTDPTLFDLERSRSLRSIAVSTANGQGQKQSGNV